MRALQLVAWKHERELIERRMCTIHDFEVLIVPRPAP
jgi:hypothetical protein